MLPALLASTVPASGSSCATLLISATRRRHPPRRAAGLRHGNPRAHDAQHRHRLVRRRAGSDPLPFSASLPLPASTISPAIASLLSIAPPTSAPSSRRAPSPRVRGPLRQPRQRRPRPSPSVSVDYILVGPGTPQMPAAAVLTALKDIAPQATALQLTPEFRTLDAHQAAELLLEMFAADPRFLIRPLNRQHSIGLCGVRFCTKKTLPFPRECCDTWSCPPGSSSTQIKQGDAKMSAKYIL